MHSFFVVTPCGGALEEVRLTVQSVRAVADAHPGKTFHHYLVFNNNVTAEHSLASTTGNYHCTVTDLGSIASRALARNTVLDELATTNARGIACFMDAGDLLLDDGAIDRVFGDIERLPEQSLWAFAARIVGANVSSTRKPRPLWTRKVGNPFFIGATFVTTQLATTVRFDEGPKEDWKYWLELLNQDPHVELCDELAYEYQVVSVADHLKRKRRLLRNQYEFFSDYLGYGHGVRTSLSMIAHIAVAGGSWVRRFRLAGRS